MTKALMANGFTRSGYSFAGWATTNTGAKAYDDGQSVTNLTDADGATVTLYAVWTANTYTVTYDGNGGTGTAPTESDKAEGAAFEAADNTFTPSGRQTI